MRTHYTGRYRRSDDPQAETSIWLISFTDTIALMLTFFVMTYAMSSPQTEAWHDVSRNFQDNFNLHEGGPLGRGAQDTISIGRVNFNRALDLRYLENLLVAQLEGQSSLEGIRLNRTARTVVLSFGDGQMFEPGMTSLNDTGRGRFYALSDLVGRMKNRVEINVRIAPDAADKWDVALGRAASVSAALRDAGYARPVMIRASVTVPEQQGVIEVVIMEDDGKQVTVFDIGAP